VTEDVLESVGDPDGVIDAGSSTRGRFRDSFMIGSVDWAR
jgi:hypothetical protein